MPNWNETINISHYHRLYTGGNIKLQQLGKGIANKLKLTESYARCDPDLMDVVCAFNALDEYACHKDYEAALAMLYEYGDKDYRLWIETMAPATKHDDDGIPSHVKTPFDDEDTKPNFIKAHYHGPNQVIKGPYITQPSEPKEVTVSITTPSARTDTIRCENVTGKNYYHSKHYHYMDDVDFKKKLAEADIEPDSLPRPLYEYMKNLNEPYQGWLIDRWREDNLTLHEATALQ